MILKVQIFSRSPKGSSLELAEDFWEKDGPSKSFVAGLPLNRRLHAFDENFWQQLLYQLSRSLLHYEETHEYAIDSFPVSVCDTP